MKKKYKYEQGGDEKDMPELNSGEVYLDSDMETILEVPNSKKFLHKNGGFKEDDVSFVLNNAYREDKKKDINKKLLITMKDIEEITGVKVKDSDKKLTHSEAFKEASEANNRKAKKLEKAVKDSYESAKAGNSTFTKNALEFNLNQLEQTPNDVEIFESLYKHQETVKQKDEEQRVFTDLEDINEEELSAIMKMRGGKLKKYETGGAAKNITFPRLEKMIAESSKKPEWKGTNDESYREGLIQWYEDIINSPYVKEDKEKLKQLLNEVKNVDPPRFGKKAGVLQRAIKKAFPESSTAYAETFPLTRTALKNLYEKNPQAYRDVVGRDWSPMDNSSTLPSAQMDELKRRFIGTEELGPKGLVDANFVDDEWYYRRPYFKDLEFERMDEYNAFLDKYSKKGIKDAQYDKGIGFVQVSPNLFINPRVARMEEINDLDEYNRVMEEVKSRPTYEKDGQTYYLNDTDNNIGEYVGFKYTGESPKKEEPHNHSHEEKAPEKQPFTLPVPNAGNDFNEDYTLLDAAGNLMTMLNSMRKDDVLYDPIEINAPDVYLNDPRPSLENATQSYNAILDTLPGSGVGYANAANVFKTKLASDNQVLGQYENVNKNLLSQRDQIKADVDFKQDALNNQARETFERKITQRDAIFDLQWNKNIDDLAQEMALNKRVNRDGDLIMSMIDHYDQYGDYNNVQHLFKDVSPSAASFLQAYADKNKKTKKTK